MTASLYGASPSADRASVSLARSQSAPCFGAIDHRRHLKRPRADGVKLVAACFRGYPAWQPPLKPSLSSAS
ncbi:MAG: hypothetical protein ACAF42_09955 [Limnothrix sp. BL-A-16]